MSGDPQGLAFDPVAEDYDRGRPGWPEAVAGAVAGREVLDLGAGTGKLTALLTRRYPHVVAVEPSEGMLAVLRRNAPQAESLLGGAEDVPLPDASVDAAFVAEAAHWFDPASAGAELWRVVRPGGTVTVCFNEWRAIFDRWAPLTEETYEHEASFRPEQVAAYYVSVSNVARLPVDEREALRSKLLELLDDGEYRLPLTARVFRTVRLDG